MIDSNRNPTIVIAGCTATGKSRLALDLAKKFNGVVVNADSRQLYKEISIGSSKPVFESYDKQIGMIDGVPHYLYGYINIKERFTVAQYKRDFDALEIEAAKPIFIVGGTGLYIDSVIFNYQLRDTGNTQLRSELEQLPLHELKERAGELLNALNKSDRNNPRRLIRVIESQRNAPAKSEPREHLYTILDLPFEKIEQKITARVEEMFTSPPTLLAEIQQLRDSGFTFEEPGLKSIGYQEFVPYFNGDATLDEVKAQIVLHTRQYAKRQLTWFKRHDDAIRVENLEELAPIVAQYLRID